MRIERIRYKNNQIVVGLSLFPDQEITPHALRSIYVKFFITTLEHRAEDLARIKGDEIRFLGETLIIRIPLENLRQLRKSSIMIDTVTLKFEDGSQKVFFLEQEYSFAALIEQEPPIRTTQSNTHFKESSEIQSPEQKSKADISPKNQLVIQEEIISTPEDTQQPIENSLSIEDKSPQEIQEAIEEHVESHLDKELPHLKISPSELIVSSLNLFLSNLPVREEEEGGLLVGSMVSSIQKYLNENNTKKKGEIQ